MSTITFDELEWKTSVARVTLARCSTILRRLRILLGLPELAAFLSIYTKLLSKLLTKFDQLDLNEKQCREILIDLHRLHEIHIRVTKDIDAMLEEGKLPSLLFQSLGASITSLEDGLDERIETISFALHPGIRKEITESLLETQGQPA